jgi:hypothetical protein
VVLVALAVVHLGLQPHSSLEALGHLVRHVRVMTAEATTPAVEENALLAVAAVLAPLVERLRAQMISQVQVAQVAPYPSQVQVLCMAVAAVAPEWASLMLALLLAQADLVAAVLAVELSEQTALMGSVVVAVVLDIPPV